MEQVAVGFSDGYRHAVETNIIYLYYIFIYNFYFLFDGVMSVGNHILVAET